MAVIARDPSSPFTGGAILGDRVTWGGNQDAKDGGLDVRVALPPGASIDGLIPKPATGFQVKTSDMRPAAIANEMSRRVCFGQPSFS